MVHPSPYRWRYSTYIRAAGRQCTLPILTTSLLYRYCSLHSFMAEIAGGAEKCTSKFSFDIKPKLNFATVPSLMFGTSY